MIYSNKLYKRSFSQPLLKCLGLVDTHYTLREVHEGICEVHIGVNALTKQVIKIKFFWLILRVDTKEFVNMCEKCQMYTRVNRQLTIQMIILISPCPFVKWGMAILGPFPPASGNRKFIIVATNYFIKCIEAIALATIITKKGFFFSSENLLSVGSAYLEFL